MSVNVLVYTCLHQLCRDLLLKKAFPSNKNNSKQPFFKAQMHWKIISVMEMEGQTTKN